MRIVSTQKKCFKKKGFLKDRKTSDREPMRKLCWPNNYFFKIIDKVSWLRKK